jgi:hypothetical protein
MKLKRKSHTTSTKCQYQIAISYLKCVQLVKRLLLNRIRVIKRNKTPIKTCVPWKPVETKKIDPYAPSLIVRGDIKYSAPWISKKYKPRKIVKPRGKTLPLLPSRSLWAQVITAPLLKRIAVFTRGILFGFIVIKKRGGQTPPDSIDGEKVEWKKAQKKLEKKNTSLIMNIIIPIFNPSTTILLWLPLLRSRPTIDHQWL